MVAETTERPPARTWLHWPAYAVMLGLLLLLGGDGTALRLVGSTSQDTISQPKTHLIDR